MIQNEIAFNDVLPVTGVSVVLGLPLSIWFAVEPTVIITVPGSTASATPSITYTYTTGSTGTVITGFTLGFSASEVGMKYHILVVSND